MTPLIKSLLTVVFTQSVESCFLLKSNMISYVKTALYNHECIFGKIYQKVLPFYGKPETAVMSSDKKLSKPNEGAEVAKSSAWLTTPILEQPCV